MKGYPKHLNTREDYEYVIANFPPSEYLQDLRNLLNTDDWFYVSTADSADELTTDDTHKVVEELSRDEDGNEVTKYVRYELRTNETAKIFQIGFTVDEVKALIQKAEDTANA